MPLILGTNSIKATGFDVANSCRFNVGSNDFLSRTIGTPTDEDKWTFSVWLKITGEAPSVQYGILSAGNYPSAYETIHLNGGDQLFYHYNDGGGANHGAAKYSGIIRDPFAWYNLIVSRNGTAVKVYINGNDVTTTVTSYNNSTNVINKSGGTLRIGHSERETSGRSWNGYMSEVVFCDGQLLDQTSFGEFDEDSGIWKPVDVSGLTFGNNGFYLDFEDSSALGNDVSGNNNDFTASNLTAIDQTTDTCTNNFMTLNPLSTDSGVTLSEGNTESDYDASVGNAKGNFGLTKGRWYWEVKLTNSTSGYPMIGIGSMNESQMQKTTGGSYPGGFTNSYGVYGVNLRLYANGVNEGTQGSSYTSGDIFGIYLDLESGTKTIKWYKNGSSVLSYNITNAGDDYPYTCIDYNGGESSVNVNYNFGNPAYSISSGNTDDNGYGNFEYSPNISSTKYYAVCTKNLAEFG